MRANRTFLTVLILLQAVFFISCNDDKDDEDNIKLSHTIFTAYNDRFYRLWIYGGSGDFSVDITEELVAHVEIEKEDTGYYVALNPRLPGEATVTVTDEQTGKSMFCTLTVAQRPGDFFLMKIGHGVDANMKETIEKDLKENDLFPLRSTIETARETASTFKCKIIAPDQSELSNGLFSAAGLPKEKSYPDSYQLLPIDYQIISYVTYTCKVENKEVFYDGFIVENSVDNKRVNHIRFYEDLTEHYQTKYPDAGVKGVVRVLYFSYIWEED